MVILMILFIKLPVFFKKNWAEIVKMLIIIGETPKGMNPLK